MVQTFKINLDAVFQRSITFVGPLDLDMIFASLSCMLDFVPNLDKKNLAAANFIAFSINMDTNSDCMICLNNIFFWILS